MFHIPFFYVIMAMPKRFERLDRLLRLHLSRMVCLAGLHHDIIVLAVTRRLKLLSDFTPTPPFQDGLLPIRVRY